MLNILISFLVLAVSLEAKILDFDIRPKGYNSSKYMGINILDSKEFVFDKFDGFKVSELSALAIQDKTLYVLSDRGYLFHFSFLVKDKKIKKFKPKKVFKLKNKKSKPLSAKNRDSEGMVIVDEKLLISFERKPRVESFSLKARKIKKHKIHKDLQKIKNYRSKNKALEALAYSEKYGLITAPELPLISESKEFHMLYSKDKRWSFKANGSITALEFMDKNNMLVLERSFDKTTRRRVITISKVYLDGCSNGVCNSEVLANLDSKDGWNIDNFEGLTKLSKSRYLMISDDNDSAFQKTLLVLFEVLDN